MITREKLYVTSLFFPRPGGGGGLKFGERAKQGSPVPVGQGSPVPVGLISVGRPDGRIYGLTSDNGWFHLSGAEFSAKIVPS